MWAARLTAVLAVLVLWILLLGQAERSVFGRVPVLDEVWYLDRAADLDGLAAPSAQPHFMSPLYPVLIKLAGSAQAVPDDRVVPAGALRGLRLLQIACWLGTAVLLRLLAGRLLPAEAPRRQLLVWLPSLLFMLYRPAAVYALTVLLELPLVFLLTLALWLLVRLPQSRRPGLTAAAVGLALGAAGLLRGTALVLVPAAAWWALRGGGLRSRASAGVLVLAALAALAPATVHNSRASGRLVGPALNGGVNLMIGNGPDANGFYVAVIDGDWRADPAGSEQLAAATAGAPPSLADADRIWAGRAWESMRAAPLRTGRLWLKKIWLHLQAWEIDQLTPLAGWTATVPLLRLLAVPWALIVVLAAAGAADLVRRRVGGSWAVPLLAVALLLAAQSLFFVVSRYRLALVPALVLLAAVGASALLQRRRGALTAAVLALLLVLPWGLGGCGPSGRPWAWPMRRCVAATWPGPRRTRPNWPVRVSCTAVPWTLAHPARCPGSGWRRCAQPRATAQRPAVCLPPARPRWSAHPASTRAWPPGRWRPAIRPRQCRTCGRCWRCGRATPTACTTWPSPSAPRATWPGPRPSPAGWWLPTPTIPAAGTTWASCWPGPGAPVRRPRSSATAWSGCRDRPS